MMRFTVFDRWGNQIGVVNDVIEAVHKDEVNGEDSLTLLLASCDLSKGDRIVWRDKFGQWHEHVVNDLKQTHVDGKMLTTAYCENSIAELFADYIEDLRPYDTSAYTALQRALSVTRWQVGAVDDLGTSSTNFYHESAREALGDIIEAWGGELSTTIEVSGASVSARKVNLTTRGRDNGKRFEWTKDMESISREVSTDDVVTALYGYGKGLEAYDEDGNATGGYERKLTFGEINGGLDYVADEDAKQLWGLPDGKGGIKHTFGKVEFSDCEDMQELLELTEAELAVRSKPQVTYTASVIDLADADFEGEDVQAGDRVAIIDRELGERLTGRVLCVERHLMNEQATSITLGNVSRSITDVISAAQSSLGRLEGHSSAWDGAASISTGYINAVINSLNVAMNKGGGYTYYRPGEGLITYDKPEDQNPTMAIQIKGAGFRIASSKKSNGDWDWRTFGTGAGFTADVINAGTLNAALIKAGILSDTAGKNYWNMETGELRIAAVPDNAAEAVREVDVEYALGDSATEAPASGWATEAPQWQAGMFMWQRTKVTTLGGDVSYSEPTCIQGASGRDGDDGAAGADGRGVRSITEQYYLSTSSTTQSGGSWSSTPASYVSGRYYWTRSYVVWDDGTASYTTPTLARGLNSANQNADAANDAAAMLQTLIRATTDGVIVGRSEDGETFSSARTLQGSDGAFHVQDADGTDLATYSADAVRIGIGSDNAIVSMCDNRVVIRRKSDGDVSSMHIATGDETDNMFISTAGGGRVQVFTNANDNTKAGLLLLDDRYALLAANNGTTNNIADGAYVLVQKTDSMEYGMVAVRSGGRYGILRDWITDAGSASGTTSSGATTTWNVRRYAGGTYDCWNLFMMTATGNGHESRFTFALPFTASSAGVYNVQLTMCNPDFGESVAGFTKLFALVESQTATGFMIGIWNDYTSDVTIGMYVRVVGVATT